MCRSIVRLRNAEPVTDPEVEAAALQFVRKISGTRAPSQANDEAFQRAVGEIAGATKRLLEDWIVPPGGRLPTKPAPRPRAAAPTA